jgi:hypothetical protein
MQSKINDKILLVVLLVSFVFYTYMAFLFFPEQNINLNKISNISSITENIEIVYFGSHKAVGIKLKDLNKELYLRTLGKKYDKYLNEIKKGDFIKIYYIDNNVVQIEKQSKIIFAKSKIEKDQTIRFWMMIFAILFTAALSYGYLQERRR